MWKSFKLTVTTTTGGNRDRANLSNRPEQTDWTTTKSTMPSRDVNVPNELKLKHLKMAIHSKGLKFL